MEDASVSSASSSCCQKCLLFSTTCLSVLFWILSLVFYTLELLFGTWSAVLYYQDGQYALFGIVAAAILIPTFVLTLVSLIWYYDQDRLYNLLREAHPDDQELKMYKRLVGTSSLFTHLILMGQIYRYAQLIILLITRSRVYDVITLQRDSSLLRFLHGFLVSAPLLSVQLYTVVTATITSTTPPSLTASPLPIVFASIVASSTSLLLTLLVYILSDRLHAERRRVVIPAYIITFLWHLFVIPSRIFALVLFAAAYGPYVSVVIGVHWGAAIIWTLAERTNFCGDLSTTPPRKRYFFEVPFVGVVSFIFIFIYFNVRDGSTMVRIIVYHLLTSVETLLLSALFYVAYPSLPFSPWVFGLSVSAYGIGIAFMFLYYVAWHPNRTDDCFLCLGCPKSCDCCQCLSDKGELHLGNVDLPLDGERREGGVIEIRSDAGNGRCNVGEEERRIGGGDASPEATSEATYTATVPNGHPLTRGSINNIPRTDPPTPTRSALATATAIRPSSQLGHHSSSAMEIRRSSALYGGSGGQPFSHRHGNGPTAAASLDNVQREKRSPQYRTPSRESMREGEDKKWPVRTNSEHFPKRMLPNSTNPRSVPLPRRRSDSQLLPVTVTNRGGYYQYCNIMGNKRQSLITHPDLSSNINLPSPIGEEPGSSDGGSSRKWSSPLPVLHVSSADSPGKRGGREGRGRGGGKERRSSGSYLPSPYSFMFVTPPTPTVAPPTSVSPYSVHNPSHLDGRLYLEPGVGRGVRRSRHRSLSPDTRSSEGSGCGYYAYPNSVSGTPKQSPYSSRRSSGSHQRKRHSGSNNPLHSGDPMVEFTQLYTSRTSPAHIRRPSSRSSARVSATFDESSDGGGGGRGVASTCSSGVFSSDKSDVAPPTSSSNEDNKSYSTVVDVKGAEGCSQQSGEIDGKWQPPPCNMVDQVVIGGDTLV